jgi:hypothetical protein
VRSGIIPRTITFLDQSTQNYIWYIIELHVDPFPLEETIDILLIPRTPSVISIPLHNSMNQPISMLIELSHDFMFGEKSLIISSNSSFDYKLRFETTIHFSKICAQAYFLCDYFEYWYSFNVTETDSPPIFLANLTSSIGKACSTFVYLENCLQKSSNFRVENDNPIAFQVTNHRKVISVLPNEKKKIEILYTPSQIGVIESATISFLSGENGDWIYKIQGIGKAPVQQPPTIVTSVPVFQSSAIIIFSNPFHLSTKFSISNFIRNF